MKVFKAVLGIIRHQKITILIYLLIPVVMSVIFGPMLGSESPTFEATSIRFGIQNYDRSPLAARLVEILETEHERVPIPEDQVSFDNELFYGGVQYVLVIPESFFEEHLAWHREGADPAAAAGLPRLGRTRNAEITAMSIEMLADRYLQQLQLMLAADPSLSEQELADTIGEGLVVSNEVEIHAERGAWSDAMDFYYRFVSYGLLSSLFFLVGLIAIAMNGTQVLPRQSVSPVSRWRLSIGRSVSTILLSSVVIIIYIAVSLVMFGSRVFSAFGLIATLNMLVFGYVALGISFFIANFIKSDEAISGVGNILPLFFAFFGGVFVPVNILGNPVRYIAPFTPTYWYTATLDLLTAQGVMNDAIMPAVYRNMGVLLAYGTVFLILSVAVAYAKGARGSKAIQTKARYG